MWSHFKELYRYRDLLLSLASRDIKVRYRQTWLGIAWAVLQPLSFMLIFTVIFAKFGKVSSDGIPYPVFSYLGLLPWTFFATALSLSVSSIGNHMSLVKKMYFPREVFPLSVTLACLVDFFISSILFLGLAIAFKIQISWFWLWLLWPLAIEIMMILALGLTLSAANVFFRDVKYIVPVATQLGLFACPIIYSVTAIPEHLRNWYMLNPMAVVIYAFRQIALHHQLPSVTQLAAGTVIAGAGMVIAYSVFKRAEGAFADAI